MGNINPKPKSKICVRTSGDDDPLSPSLHFDREARVDSFILKGVGKTKDDLIVPIAKELFLSTTYGEVITRAEHVAKNLEDLDCFKKVNILIDSSKGPDATPYGLEVTLKLEELPWIQFQLGAEEKEEEGMLGLGLRLPNIFGQAEKVEGGFTLCGGGAKQFHATAYKPFEPRGNSVLHATVYDRDGEHEGSGYRLESKGFRAGVSFNSLPKTRHTLVYEGLWRSQTCLDPPDTPHVITNDCGDTFKSCLRHVVHWDERAPHAPGFPPSGRQVTLTSEFAGLGGDVGFFKNEIRAKSSALLLKNLAGEMTGQAGVMVDTRNKHSFMSDKFYLGGGSSLRGFEDRGAGPHSHRLATGGDVYYAGGLHLYYRIPHPGFQKRFGDNFRLHAFTSAGSCGEMDQASDVTGLVKDLARSVRVSCGAGVSVQLGQRVNLELNYCLPLRYQEGDQTSQGMQFGLGINFT